jgi:hypothetical protein
MVADSEDEDRRSEARCDREAELSDGILDGIIYPSHCPTIGCSMGQLHGWATRPVQSSSAGEAPERH